MAESRPTSRTSHYGWALWHLEQADQATVSGPEGAMYHVAAAQVRATLHNALELGAQRGVDPGGPFTWSHDEPACPWCPPEATP